MAASSSNSKTSFDDAARIDQYDSKTFTRNRINTRVVVKEKPLIKSRTQKFIEWIRPSTRPGHSVVDTTQLVKVFAIIIFPVAMLGYWKVYQQRLPDEWESKFANLQHRQFREEKTEATSNDYFTIIDNFQERRQEALAKQQQGK